MATRTFEVAFKTESVTPHAVLAFREEHRLGRPSAVTVTCQLVEAIDLEEVVGTGAALSFVVGDDGTPYAFSGIVDAVTLFGSTAMGAQSVHHARFHVVSQMALFERTTNSTHCPYKGDASYYTIKVGDRAAENAIWSYETPFPAMKEIEGCLAFYPNRVDKIEVEPA